MTVRRCALVLLLAIAACAAPPETRPRVVPLCEHALAAGWSETVPCVTR